MHPLLLSGHLPDISGLLPLFFIPISAIILLPSIPAVRYLSKRGGSGKTFVLLLLGLLNFVVGLYFVLVTHAVWVDAPDVYRQRNGAMVVFSYIGGGAMIVVGGYALRSLLRRHFRVGGKG